MSRESYPLSQAYGLLEPGPVVLMTTAGNGRANVMAQSWHTMMEFEPPLIGCIVSDHNHTFGMLKASMECVLCIPSVELAEQVVGCGNSTGAKIDKFTSFGLTPSPAENVGAPLIEACFANLECRVVDTRMVNRYGLFVLEVVKAWLDTGIKNPKTIHHLGCGNFMVSGEHIRLASAVR